MPDRNAADDFGRQVGPRSSAATTPSWNSGGLAIAVWMAVAQPSALGKPRAAQFTATSNFTAHTTSTDHFSRLADARGSSPARAAADSCLRLRRDDATPKFSRLSSPSSSSSSPGPPPPALLLFPMPFRVVFTRRLSAVRWAPLRAPSLMVGTEAVMLKDTDTGVTSWYRTTASTSVTCRRAMSVRTLATSSDSGRSCASTGRASLRFVWTLSRNSSGDAKPSAETEATTMAEIAHAYWTSWRLPIVVDWLVATVLRCSAVASVCFTLQAVTEW